MNEETTPNDWSLLGYVSVIGLLLLGFVGVMWVGEEASLRQALRYLAQHRRGGEMLLTDVSIPWVAPQLQQEPNTVVVDQHYPLESKQLSQVLWLLEQSSTKIRRVFPTSLQCAAPLRFGRLRHFQVRRCHQVDARSFSLHQVLRKAAIESDGKPCTWRGSACLFDRHRTWKRVEYHTYFPVGGIGHSCIYAHAHANRWLSLRFPPQKAGRGLRIGFGFKDHVGSDVPLRAVVLFHHQKKKRTLLDVTIPHAPDWHRHFFSPAQLGAPSGSVELRIWTRHAGAKSFCMNAIVLQTPTKQSPKKARR